MKAGREGHLSVIVDGSMDAAPGLRISPVWGFHRARALQARSDAAIPTYLAVAAGIFVAVLLVLVGCVYLLLCRSPRLRERGRGVSRSRTRTAAAPTVSAEEHTAKAPLGCRSICDPDTWAFKTACDTVYVVDAEDRRSCSSVNTEPDMPELIPVTPRWNAFIADYSDMDRFGSCTRNATGFPGFDGDDDEEPEVGGIQAASGGSFSSDCLSSCWTPSALRGALRSVALSEEADAQISPDQATWCGNPCILSNEAMGNASGSHGSSDDAREDDERTLPPDSPRVSQGYSSASGSSSELRSGSRSEVCDHTQAQVWPWSPPLDSSLPPLPSLPGLVNGWHEEDACTLPTLNRPQTDEPD